MYDKTHFERTLSSFDARVMREKKWEENIQRSFSLYVASFPEPMRDVEKILLADVSQKSEWNYNVRSQKGLLRCAAK